MFSRGKDAPGAEQQSPKATDFSPKTDSAESISVIRSDMKIFGDGLQVTARQPIQVDGEILGNISGTHIAIEQTGLVKGLVNAENIYIDGKVEGTVRGVHVFLSTTAHVNGDIHHCTLSLEMGAHFEGGSHKVKDKSEVLPNLSNTTRGAPGTTSAG